MSSILSILVVGIVVGIFLILSATIFADCNEDQKEITNKSPKDLTHS